MKKSIQAPHLLFDISTRLSPPTCPVSLHGIPDVAVEVVVTSQKQTARARESHRGDTADDVIMAVEAELLVGTQVKQPASGIIGARGEGAAVGKELRGEHRKEEDSNSYDQDTLNRKRGQILIWTKTCVLIGYCSLCCRADQFESWSQCLNIIRRPAWCISWKGDVGGWDTVLIDNPVNPLVCFKFESFPKLDRRTCLTWPALLQVS